MRVYGLRVFVVAVAFLFGMLFFFSVNQFYTAYNVEKPLAAEIEKIPDIKEYEIEKANNVYVVSTTMNETADLGQSYRDIQVAAGKVVRGGNFQIVLKDNSSEELCDAYYNSQYIVYEAIVCGNFQEMAKTVRHEAQEIGASAKVYVDEENIYIHLAKEGRYLNRVIPRNAPGGELIG